MEGTPKRLARKPSVLTMPSADTLRRAAAATETDAPAASIRPSRYRDHDEILDNFGALVSADATQAIARVGHKSRMRTTRGAFEKGLGRWQSLREVRDFLTARRTLDAAGSAEVHQFANWQPTLAGAKRYSLYGVTKQQAADCADLGRALGVGTERMAGLCVEAGIVDVAGTPIPTNHRIAHALRHVRADLRDRVRKIERLCEGESADPQRIVTWDEIMGERKSGGQQTRSRDLAGGRGNAGRRS